MCGGGWGQLRHGSQAPASMRDYAHPAHLCSFRSRLLGGIGAQRRPQGTLGDRLGHSCSQQPLSNNWTYSVTDISSLEIGNKYAGQQNSASLAQHLVAFLTCLSSFSRWLRALAPPVLLLLLLQLLNGEGESAKEFATCACMLQALMLRISMSTSWLCRCIAFPVRPAAASTPSADRNIDITNTRSKSLVVGTQHTPTNTSGNCSDPKRGNWDLWGFEGRKYWDLAHPFSTRHVVHDQHSNTNLQCAQSYGTRWTSRVR